MAKSCRKSGTGARGCSQRERRKGYGTMHQPDDVVRVPREHVENAGNQPAVAI